MLFMVLFLESLITFQTSCIGNKDYPRNIFLYLELAIFYYCDFKNWKTLDKAFIKYVISKAVTVDII